MLQMVFNRECLCLPHTSYQELKQLNEGHLDSVLCQVSSRTWQPGLKRL